MAKPARITAVKGFRDVLPDESARWQALESEALGVFAGYGFGEIGLPIAEKTELFARSIGASTDIVEKEMYTFIDRGDSSITLRPEATAGVVRAAIEHGLAARDREIRLFYRGPMFRRERPQRGRFRQFHQIGAEVLGRDDPVVDAELLLLLRELLDRVGAAGAVFEVNSLGDQDCRPAYRERLHAFAARRSERLCENCRRRLDHNPLRILDCKEPACREALGDAPLIIESLCRPCAAHFDAVRDLVAAAGLAVVLNPRIVRGLDYYCRTAFEVTAEGLGSQNAVGGGGRYDRLVEDLGGPPVPGVGFALGVDRLIMVARGLAPAPERADVVIAPLGERATTAGLRMATALRRAGRRVELAAPRRGLRAVMRQADRIGARHVVMIGEEELACGLASVRDMERKQDRPRSVDLEAAGERLVAAIDGHAG
jgi:histidyl-tRNA synthetase